MASVNKAVLIHGIATTVFAVRDIPSLMIQADWLTVQEETTGDVRNAILKQLKNLKRK